MLIIEVFCDTDEFRNKSELLYIDASFCRPWVSKDTILSELGWYEFCYSIWRNVDRFDLIRILFHIYKIKVIILIFQRDKGIAVTVTFTM